MLPAHPFPVALINGDIDTVTELLAPDVVLYSPILARYRFEGRDEVGALLAAVSQIMVGPEILEDFGDRDRRLVALRGHIRGKRIEVVTLLKLDGPAKVLEIKIFARPLPGLAALMAALGPKLAARRSTAAARLTTAMLAPLAAGAPVFDRVAERLVVLR